MNFVEQIISAVAAGAVLSIAANLVGGIIQNAVTKQRWVDRDTLDRARHNENKETLAGQDRMLRDISQDVKRINGTVTTHTERLEAQRREIDRLRGTN